MASIIEDAHNLRQELPVNDSTSIGRLNAIIESAGKRLATSQNAAAVAEFNALEEDVTQLLARNEFQQAEDRIASYQASGGQLFNDSKERLAKRVSAERERYIQNLGQQVTRLKLGKNIDGLRELRSELPAAMLGEPIAQLVNEAIREVENTLQSESENITASHSSTYFMRGLPNLSSLINNCRRFHQTRNYIAASTN